MQHVNLKKDPINLIYDGLATQAEHDVRHFKNPPQRFRASEMANCARQIAYRLSGYLPEPRTQFLSLVGAAGDMYHNFARAVGRNYGLPIKGIEFGADGKQDEGAVITGSFNHGGASFEIACRADGDMAVDLETGVVDAVLEIKTVGDRAMYWMEKEFAAGGTQAVMKYLQDKRPGYVWQGNTTALLKGRDYVYLWLVNRSTAQQGLYAGGRAITGQWAPGDGRRAGGTVWRVEPEDKTAILDKAARVRLHIEAGTLPDPEYTPSSTMCKQCPFFYLCHGAEQRKANGMTPKYPMEGVIDL